ncbi:uncharacterized protein EI90DRAFT_2924032 [Cantharellus anzutake]|uniref:uncharacterized protein n=1 Tax=Cantharellus anzutake TaxID=1750568 RepID=UPI00190540B3|nr:uncharacterized protein EI90DRAFT_2924032 [Cantharellus anzutake]KAF8329507.1 hypothetical protein EI90DRAFT_2924032 [Cantharellus anzutake]
MRVEEGFQPPSYVLPHPYSEDTVLPSLLKRLAPEPLRSNIERDLIRWGEDIRGPIQKIGALVDQPHTQPWVRQYDNYGKRIDELFTSEGWRIIKAIAFKEGLVSIAYDRAKYAEWARVYSFLKIAVGSPDLRMIMCPFSMTDGCARVIELYGTAQMKSEILPRLLSRDPSVGFTSGQWMTERPGGSDLSQIESTASRTQEHGFGSELWRINGFKWFSSATDGDISLALARTGESLSLFLVPVRVPLIPGPPVGSIALGINARTIPQLQPVDTKLNGIRIHRLKNKIGTQPVPTAELELHNTQGYLVGPLNQGIKSVIPVLTITRLHSAIMSISCLGRSLQIAKAYANVRVITNSNAESGGTLLRKLPLHTYTLAKASVLYRALTHMVFGAVVLLGRSENGNASVEEFARLRLLIPVAKGFASSFAVSGMEECMASMGSQGYMEETGIGRMIRDSLVEKIWEGTANVLALDVLRACKDAVALDSFYAWGNGLVERASCLEAFKTVEFQLDALSASLRLVAQLRTLLVGNESLDPIFPRPFFYFIGEAACGLYLLEHALWSAFQIDIAEADARIDIEAFAQWTNEGPSVNGTNGGGVRKAQEEVERVLANGRKVQSACEMLTYGVRQPAKL